MRWDLVLERESVNRLNTDIQKKNLRKIAAVAKRNQSLGFEGRIGKLGEPELVVSEKTNQEVHRYRVRLRLVKERVRDEDAARRQFEHIVKIVSRYALSQGWILVAGEERDEQGSGSEDAGLSAVKNEPRGKFVVPELTPEVLSTYFSGIYERHEQIRNIHSAVQMAQDTNGAIIPHVLLYGRPGACKTVLTERFKTWFDGDSKVERVKFVDCTTMTQAGVENWLLDQTESETLPEVLVLDEIEKQDKKNLNCFLSIMGSGIIARLNSRIGNRRSKVAFVVVGICNDEKQLKEWNDGALWSRFGSNKLYCPRPSKSLCLKILLEMVKQIPNGKPQWAEKALDFGWEELGERDIREIKDHLCGRDRLLTREWQEDKLRMLAAKRKDEQEEEALEKRVINAGGKPFNFVDRNSLNMASSQ